MALKIKNINHKRQIVREALRRLGGSGKTKDIAGVVTGEMGYHWGVATRRRRDVARSISMFIRLHMGSEISVLRNPKHNHTYTLSSPKPLLAGESYLS